MHTQFISSNTHQQQTQKDHKFRSTSNLLEQNQTKSAKWFKLYHQGTTSEPGILLYERSTLYNESPNDFKPPLNSNKFLE
ncbi:hypothetical protein HanXRQr2_Chr16g0730201 [Helianthus annuus]|uniref:Uncharacterized protein n=1 Tax=Helianthus annuus TaxID=4232 RepID=A0A9K3DPT7_HELAN|nr:hypothetical protein HanXRQr2_Chr16g0730201 [Helianthus annuus]